MSMPCLLADLMMQFWTYFSRFRKCQLSFMPFASALHAAVAFSRAILSAADIFAASAGVGTNAMPLISTRQKSHHRVEHAQDRNEQDDELAEQRRHPRLVGHGAQ